MWLAELHLRRVPGSLTVVSGNETLDAHLLTPSSQDESELAVVLGSDDVQDTSDNSRYSVLSISIDCIRYLLHSTSDRRGPDNG